MAKAHVLPFQTLRALSDTELVISQEMVLHAQLGQEVSPGFLKCQPSFEGFMAFYTGAPSWKSLTTAVTPGGLETWIVEGIPHAGEMGLIALLASQPGTGHQNLI